MSRYCQGPGLQQPGYRPEPVQGLWLIGPLSYLHSWSLLCWLGCPCTQQIALLEFRFLMKSRGSTY